MFMVIDKLGPAISSCWELMLVAHWGTFDLIFLTCCSYLTIATVLLPKDEKVEYQEVQNV